MTSLKKNDVDSAPLHLVVGQFASRAQSAIKPTGWRFTDLFFNEKTGYVKINLLMRSSPRYARTINIRRSMYGENCLFQRGIVEVRHSNALGEWLDTCDSTLIGRDYFSNIRSVLRACSAYLIDNPAPGRSAIGSMESMQILNEMFFPRLPNPQDQRAGASPAPMNPVVGPLSITEK